MSNNDDDRLRDNPLADQLARVDVDVSEQSDEKDKKDTTQPPAQTGSSSSDELSDEELFRQAIEGLDDDDIPAGTGTGPPPSGDTENTADTETAPQDDVETTTPGNAEAFPGQTAAPLSERELFEQAVDNLDPAEIYSGKFQGRAGASLPDEPDRASAPRSTTASDDDEATADDVQRLRDTVLFEEMVGPVNPIDNRDKYRLRRRKQPTPITDDEPGPEERLLTPLLPRSGEGLNHIPRLVDSQRALLEGYRRYESSRDVPELYLRGETATRSGELIREFIPRHHKRGARYLRIVTGRGLRSKSEPVIKPTVLDWLHTTGLDYIRGYAPERTRSGDYGSLIIELSTTSP